MGDNNQTISPHSTGYILAMPCYALLCDVLLYHVLLSYACFCCALLRLASANFVHSFLQIVFTCSIWQAPKHRVAGNEPCTSHNAMKSIINIQVPEGAHVHRGPHCTLHAPDHLINVRQPLQEKSESLIPRRQSHDGNG